MDKGVIYFLRDVGTARALLNMTLEEVADKCGTSKSNIHGIENMRQEPKIGLAIKLSSVLMLDLNDYFS